jgi:peptide/nickel transport system permease protein
MASSTLASATVDAPSRALRFNRSAPARLLRSSSGLVGGAIILFLLIVALVGPLVLPYDPVAMDVRNRLQAPSAQHWFGTDEFGRDILTRVVYGARITFMIGAVSVAIGLTIGGSLGLVAGYFGGKLDLVISVVTDILLAFPNFLLALAIVSALGPSLENAMIAVGVRTVPLFSRVVRANTIATREHEYVTAARTIGAERSRIILRHVLPNIVASVIVLASLEFPAAVLVAAGLSFLGLGAQPPSPEWGSMLVGARELIRTAPWAVNAPGFAIMLTVLGFNLLGNALRDTLDPRLRRT